MRPSAERHTLARLRRKLDKTQQQMADLVGCSRRTIEAIELGNLKLSAKLAEKIHSQTGVDPAWLARGETKSPMVDCSGKKYDCGKFAEIQLQAKSSFDAASLPSVLATFGKCVLDLMSSLLPACEQGKFVQWVFVLQTDLEKLRKRFGTSGEITPLLNEVVLAQCSREKPDFQPMFDKLHEMLKGRCPYGKAAPENYTAAPSQDSGTRPQESANLQRCGQRKLLIEEPWNEVTRPLD